MDEVHQATKEHPMSSILKDFHWRLAPKAAPKVVAMLITINALTEMLPYI